MTGSKDDEEESQDSEEEEEPTKKKKGSGGNRYPAQTRVYIRDDEMDIYNNLKKEGYSEGEAIATAYLMARGRFPDPQEEPTPKPKPQQARNVEDSGSMKKLSDMPKNMEESAARMAWVQAEAAQKAADDERTRLRRLEDEREQKMKQLEVKVRQAEERMKQNPTNDNQDDLTRAIKQMVGLQVAGMSSGNKNNDDVAEIKKMLEDKDRKESEKRMYGRMKRLEDSLGMLVNPEAQIQQSLHTIEMLKNNPNFKEKSMLDAQSIGAIADVVGDGFDKWANIKGQEMKYKQTVGKYREAIMFFKELKQMGVLDAVLGQPTQQTGGNGGQGSTQFQPQHQVQPQQQQQFQPPPPDPDETVRHYQERVAQAQAEWERQQAWEQQQRQQYQQPVQSQAPPQENVFGDGSEIKQMLRGMIKDVVQEVVTDSVHLVEETNESGEDDISPVEQNISTSSSDIVEQMAPPSPEALDEMNRRERRKELYHFFKDDLGMQVSWNDSPLEVLEQMYDEYCSRMEQEDGALQSQIESDGDGQSVEVSEDDSSGFLPDFEDEE